MSRKLEIDITLAEEMCIWGSFHEGCEGVTGSAGFWCNSARVMCMISRRWPLRIFSELRSSISTSFNTSREV